MSEDYRIVELSDNECWEILDRERFGRLAVAVHGDPDIFPVNFLVDDGKLLMRTAPGTKLTELVINSAVAVEADGAALRVTVRYTLARGGRVTSTFTREA
jgi:nitroimidazol reductase NimA-like FMN-containing flavoprotein (pyridoxamine 5'-phosphate oxidase superfamily)